MAIRPQLDKLQQRHPYGPLVEPSVSVLLCVVVLIIMYLRLEDQAFDRAHRLGQKLDVNIFKLTIELTVEDREFGSLSVDIRGADSFRHSRFTG